MSTLPAGVEFRRLIIPASIDAPDAADFVEMTRVRNAVYREITGHDDETLPPDELLPFYRPSEDEERRLWAVLDAGRFVGRVSIDIPAHPGSRNIAWIIELLREVWGRGIGSAAHDLVEETAREHGRTVLQSWAEHPARVDESEAILGPPTGFGEIPLDHAARFYRAQGYALEQVERNSVLDPVAAAPRIDALLAEAEAASLQYRVVQWQAPTPPEFADGYAWMKSRMNTDAPAAGLEFDEEAWDSARVARHDAKYTDAGRILQVTAAQHVETGDLCAFNELVIGRDLTATTHQEDTLVLREHRGHRLGMRVKCAALVAWRQVAPGSRRVDTFNAEENRPMLDVNEAIGFAPIAYEGAWKKVLDD